MAQQPVAQVDLSVTNETRGAPPTVVALTPIAHALSQHTFTRTRHKMAAFTFNPLVLSARAVAPAKATRSTRRAAKSALRCSATSEEEDVMGEIGLGDLEDIMAKADGGASVPKFIADLGIEPLTEGFKFLGSDQMTGPGSEMLFVEKFGETLYREAGFTETAEKINGRLAVRTFPTFHPPTYPSPHGMTPSILDRRVASRGESRCDATRKIATRAGSKIKQCNFSAAPFPPTHKRTIQKSTAALTLRPILPFPRPSIQQQVGFVLAVQNTFNGDVLELIAKYPLLVFLTVAGIAGASLVPTCNPQGYFPDGIKDTTMKAYEGAGLGDVFSAKAEMINGRAAMLGMAAFIATATIF